MFNFAKDLLDTIDTARQNTAGNRDLVIPKPVVMGGSGDVDMKGFLTDELQHHTLVQEGVNGMRFGSTATITDRSVLDSLKADHPYITEPGGSSKWGTRNIGSPYYATRNGPRCDAPSVPSGLDVTGLRLELYPIGINIVWNQMTQAQFGRVNGGYKLYRCASPDVSTTEQPLLGYNVITDILANFNQDYIFYADTGLDANTLYCYKVVPYNCKGDATVPSNKVCGQPLPETPGEGDPVGICIHRWSNVGTFCEPVWTYITSSSIVYYDPRTNATYGFNPETDRLCSDEENPQPHLNQKRITQWVFDCPSASACVRFLWNFRTIWVANSHVLTDYERPCGIVEPVPPDYYDITWDGH